MQSTKAGDVEQTEEFSSAWRFGRMGGAAGVAVRRSVALAEARSSNNHDSCHPDWWQYI
jgi:hypothetical protein